MTDEEETDCPGEGECDDAYCEEREEYEVEFTITVKGTVMAHSEEEADELAGAVVTDLDAELPTSFPEEWSDHPSFYGADYSLNSMSMRAARAAETAAWMAKASA